MPPPRARALSTAAALFAAAVLTGCASSRLSAERPPGEHLAGDWKLDAARSDDLGRAVEQLRAQAAKARRRDKREGQPQDLGSATGHRHRGGSGGQPGAPPGGEDEEDESAPGADSSGPAAGVGGAPQTSPVDELMSTVPRGDYLRITVSSSAFTVTSGDSSDDYTPGLESEISAEQGDARQISGWKGPAYVIDTTPQWGAEIIQSYALTNDGRLAMTLRLTGRGIRFTFTRVYDRTTRVAPLAPPTNN
jgi:hypothetical protein